MATAPSLSNPPATLGIVETFHSVQGEGYWAGTNAFFIRLAGCDVGCPWCDTKVSWNPKRHPQVPIVTLRDQVQEAQPRLVIITGGEPLLQDLTPLTQALQRLAQITPDYLAIFELLWSPQSSEDCLTEDELLCEYTDMILPL